MHTTDTIDFEVVLGGHDQLELDDGAEVTLRPRRHGGPERHPAPVEERAATDVARLAVFICGASHAGIPPG